MQRQHAVAMLRYHRVTMTGRMRKAVAISVLALFYAARRIQRWFRERTQLSALCPISLEPVRDPCVSIRLAPCVYVRYNMHAFHEFLTSSTGAVVREPTSNRPLTPRTMRRIVRRMGACGFAVYPRARPAGAGIVDCLENVVDTLMAEALEEEAFFTDDALLEWARNIERAVAAIAVHSRSLARIKAQQCVASCGCTALCAERELELCCPHEACAAVLRGVLATLAR
jgi:hypothetical protein